MSGWVGGGGGGWVGVSGGWSEWVSGVGGWVWGWVRWWSVSEWGVVSE